MPTRPFPSRARARPAAEHRHRRDHRYIPVAEQVEVLSFEALDPDVGLALIAMGDS